jgi:hypothetical protein
MDILAEFDLTDRFRHVAQSAKISLKTLRLAFFRHQVGRCGYRSYGAWHRSCEYLKHETGVFVMAVGGDYAAKNTETATYV